MSRFSDYKSYFEPHIFDRGINISHTDAVTIISISENEVYATVEGTERYDVYLGFDNQQLSASCSCPYAEIERLCKHMAAVMIVTEKLTEPESIKKNIQMLHKPELLEDYEEESQLLKERLSGIPQEALIDFLTTALMQDTTLLRSFMTRFMADQINVNELINAFNNIIEYAKGRNGFIDYSRASDFFDEVYDFMEDLRTLFHSGHVIETALVLSSITPGFDELPLDDSGGGAQLFYEQVDVLVKDILDTEIQEADLILYDWMKYVMNDPNSWYLQEWVQRYLDK